MTHNILEVGAGDGPVGQSANWMDGKSSTKMKISDVKSEILAPPDHGVQIAPHLYLTTQL
jgi:hypothetical protein